MKGQWQRYDSSVVVLSEMVKQFISYFQITLFLNDKKY